VHTSLTSVLLVTALAACNGQATTAASSSASSAAPPGEHSAHAEPASATAQPGADGWTSYGQTVTGSAVSLGQMLADAPRLEGQNVVASGRVSEVCQKAGCWMVLSDEARHVRIRMKDHGFSVDKAGAGREAVVMGTLISKPVDPAEVAHYASETRDGGVVPEHAIVDGKTWEIEAVGVRMKAL
jgi:hypothetical protein